MIIITIINLYVEIFISLTLFKICLIHKVKDMKGINKLVQVIVYNYLVYSPKKFLNRIFSADVIHFAKYQINADNNLQSVYLYFSLKFLSNLLSDDD